MKLKSIFALSVSALITCSALANSNGVETNNTLKSMSSDKNSWAVYGNPNFLDPASGVNNLDFSQNGVPFAGVSSPNGMSVFTLSNKIWQQVGNTVPYGSMLALDQNGNPLILSINPSTHRVRVYDYYTNKGWVNDKGSITAPANHYIASAEIAVSPQGNLYLFYSMGEDFDSNYKPGQIGYLDEYNPTSNTWTQLGSISLPVDFSRNMNWSFKLDQDGTPTVAATTVIEPNGDDKGVSKYKIIIKQFNLAKNNWESLGSPVTLPSSFNIPASFSFAFNTKNIPYVAYDNCTAVDKVGDCAASNASVVSLNGDQWQLVGAANFIPENNTLFGLSNIVISSQNVPYITYTNTGNTASAGLTTALYFNGTAWVTAGNANFSNTATGDGSLFWFHNFNALSVNPLNDKKYYLYLDAHTDAVTIDKYKS